MRTASLRSGTTPFGRISELTAEFTQFRRAKVPEQAEVVAVHGDDDWFALFADEKDLAPRTGRRRGAITPEPIEREPAGPVPTSPAKPTELAVREAQPSIEAWELTRFAPEEDPAWLKRVLSFDVAQWSGIAAGIVLGAGVLLFAARNLGGEGTAAPPEVTTAPVSAESGTAAPLPALLQSVVYAPSTSTSAATPAPRKPAARTKTAPPPRTETRNSRVAERSVALRSPSSARPSPTPRPTPTPIPTSTPISIANAGPAATLNPVPTAAKTDAAPGPAAAPAASAPPPPAPPSDTVLIRSLLDLYRQAYSSLNADAVAAVWPSVNTRSLARAFSQLESQRFEFTDCRIDVSVARAQAICAGRASFVPKIGGRTTRTESREWAFVLQRMNDGWIISRADAR